MTLPTRRRFGAQVLAGGAAAATLSAPARANDLLRWGASRVYTQTNNPAGNEVLIFAPLVDGNLELVQRVATDGLGTGSGLGSQAAVALSGDGRHLYAVNAGSHTVSTLALRRGGAELVSVVASGGAMPTSVAESDGLVYVLNAGGNGNVAGFRDRAGMLQPLADGLRGLSAAGGTAPAQVGFSDSGDALVVTERATQRLSTYRVRRDGTLEAQPPTASPGPTPFGFGFDRRDHLIVSEAFGGQANASAASSYAFRPGSARPVVVSASVATTQTAACWVAVAPNGRLAYTGNAGSSSVSSYRIDARSGAITLAHAVAGSTGGGATDLAVTLDGRFLVVLAGRVQQIVRFRTAYDGTLEEVGRASGLPAGCVGIAAD